jgi:hypothetical protein
VKETDWKEKEGGVTVKRGYNQIAFALPVDDLSKISNLLILLISSSVNLLHVLFPFRLLFRFSFPLWHESCFSLPSSHELNICGLLLFGTFCHRFYKWFKSKPWQLLWIGDQSFQGRFLYWSQKFEWYTHAFSQRLLAPLSPTTEIKHCQIDNMVGPYGQILLSFILRRAKMNERK